MNNQSNFYIDASIFPYQSVNNLKKTTYSPQYCGEYTKYFPQKTSVWNSC